jgi:hypothetical protein
MNILTQLKKNPRIAIGVGLLLVLLYGSVVYLLIVNNNLKNEILTLYETIDITNNALSDQTATLNEQVAVLNTQIANIRNPITYRPLIFETNEEGYAVINSVRLGFENQSEKMIQVQEYLPHNPVIEKNDERYAYVKSVEDEVMINHYVTIEKHKLLVLKPGYYYLGTNLGDFRILVLKKGISELQRFFKIFYFYTSIAARGRCADYLSGYDALQFVFYSNMYSGNFCTGHVRLFQSIFKEYFQKMRPIDFYGFIREDGKEIPEGHSVLEVYIDGKWVLVDPMLGFIPFDETGKNPLSFIEFLQAKRNNTYVLKYQFLIPDFSFYYEKDILREEEHIALSGKYEYLSKIQNDERFFNYFNKTDFEYLWSITDLLIYIIGDKRYFFMEKEIYDNMKQEDWERYTHHYQPFINKHRPSELKELVNLNINDLYQ